jgi:hypothetical protein
MTAIEVLHAVKEVGGSLSLNGDHLKYSIPQRAVWLLPNLRQRREALIELLRQRETHPAMPRGVRLVKWEPKNPPIAIVRMGIVNNTDKFIHATLRELRARLEGKDFLAGNWSLRELVDRLEQVGVLVTVESTQRGAGRHE